LLPVALALVGLVVLAMPAFALGMLFGRAFLFSHW
jgi:hypothetical protein